MSSPSTHAEVTSADTAGRWPLSLLLASGLVWLVASGALALVASIQLFLPSYLGDCAWFTFGRMSAMAETAFVYGWAANAGLAVGLWVLARLGGSSLRALNWVVVGTLFWNTGIALGLVGIATGDATSFSLFQMPRYVLPLLVAAYASVGVAGILAWTGRRSDGTHASQWYAVAAIFLFPWLLIVAQAMLLWTPVRGVLQAVTAGWYVQGVFTLWLAPLALAGAYYVVPKLTGRVSSSYAFAPLAFWTLIFAGALTGGRYLIGGPVPAWIPTLANAASWVLLFHYLVVVLNLKGIFSSAGLSAKFTAFGLLVYIAVGALDFATSFRGVAACTQFTYFTVAQQQLAVYGAVTCLFFGAIYFAVPRILGRAWASAEFGMAHLVLTLAGIALLVGSLAGAGWMQAQGLSDPKVTFADISLSTRPWLMTAAAAQLVLFVGNLLLLVNFARSACGACCNCAEPSEVSFRQPSSTEASAS